MKKVSRVLILFLALVALFSISFALAEGASTAPALPVAVEEGQTAPAAPYPIEQEGAYNWGQLATIAGATAAVLLIVQFIKLPIDKVLHVPTRLIVYVIALLIMTGAQAFTVGFVWQDLPLIAINAFVVALAAMGSYEVTFNRTGNG